MDAAAACHAAEGDMDNEKCQAVAPEGDCGKFFGAVRDECDAACMKGPE